MDRALEVSTQEDPVAVRESAQGQTQGLAARAARSLQFLAVGTPSTSLGTITRPTLATTQMSTLWMSVILLKMTITSPPLARVWDLDPAPGQDLGQEQELAQDPGQEAVQDPALALETMCTLVDPATPP